MALYTRYYRKDNQISSSGKLSNGPYPYIRLWITTWCAFRSQAALTMLPEGVVTFLHFNLTI